MCTSCGCGIPADGHGNPAHLKIGRIQRAASAAGLPLPEAAWNIPRSISDAITPDGDRIPMGVTLVMDVDGVLAFAAEAIVTALNARFGTAYSAFTDRFFPGSLLDRDLPPEQDGWLREQLDDPVFLGNMAPDWRAMDVLRDAWDSGRPVLVATARREDMRKPTADWLADWGSPLPAENVYATGHGNKPAWMAARFGPEHPAVLVDDSPAVELTIARPGIETWVPARPYNDRPVRPYANRFRNWGELRWALGLGPQP